MVIDKKEKKKNIKEEWKKERKKKRKIDFLPERFEIEILLTFSKIVFIRSLGIASNFETYLLE